VIACPTIPALPPTRTCLCTASPRVLLRRGIDGGTCSTASPTPARRSWSISRRYRSRFHRGQCHEPRLRPRQTGRASGSSSPARRRRCARAPDPWVRPPRARYRETMRGPSLISRAARSLPRAGWSRRKLTRVTAFLRGDAFQGSRFHQHYRKSATMVRRTMLDSRRNVGLACALSALAGYVDAIGFLHLGGLFVSFMSGNSTRMGSAWPRGSGCMRPRRSA